MELRDRLILFNALSIANYAVSAIGSAAATTWSTTTTTYSATRFVSPTETNVQTLAKGVATLVQELKDRGLI